MVSKSDAFKRAIYSPRKQEIWGQCERILGNQLVILTQVNNMSTPEMAEFRHQLRQRGLFLRFPKPGILRAYLRSSQWSAFEPAIVGNTCCAISNEHPEKLREALQILQSRPNVILLGGKFLNYQLTREGIQEVIETVPTLQTLQAQLAGLLSSPAQGLVQGMQRAPLLLSGSLKSHQDVNLNPE